MSQKTRTEWGPEERRFFQHIERYGWSVTGVGAGDGVPQFAYTTGLYEHHGHRELLCIGLRHELMHSMLNLIGSRVRAGTPPAIGEDQSEVIEGFPVRVYPVSLQQQRAFTCWSDWYYTKVRGLPQPAPVLQVVYPDRQGRWPWEPGVTPGFVAQQPLVFGPEEVPLRR